MSDHPSLPTPRRIVVVGASLAGLRTVQELRRKGYDGMLALVGDEDELPYDRPPLSKSHLAVDGAGEVVPLVTAQSLIDQDVELVLGRSAQQADLAGHTLTLDDGTTHTWDRLVVATGARARTFPNHQGLDGFVTLRTRADADRLRVELGRQPRVVVLGGGFIGAEIAAAARKRDLPVTLIEMLPAPMSAGLGETVGRLLGRLHTDHGVSLRCNTTVTEVHGRDRVQQLVLSDGTTIDCDVVVVGIGVVPNTEWLAGSGLDVTNGVLCGPDLRALGTDDVYAAGDVARWPHPLFGPIRVEHWTNAQEHATVVAGALLGESTVADAVPYVWSDQYDRRIQIVGRPQASHAVTVIKDTTDGRHIAVHESDGRMTGVLVIDQPKLFVRARRAIAAGTSAADFMAEHVPGAVPD